ncbi:MAG: hypothetical protein LBU25_06205, partial [Treponema sp.]|nr:hypothetical protein [Treponema sp.]
KTLDKTRFAAIAEDLLGITLIPAYTPQAKGRIERLWGTLQDRLPIWLRLEGVSGMDAANAALNRAYSIDPWRNNLKKPAFYILYGVINNTP